MVLAFCKHVVDVAELAHARLAVELSVAFHLFNVTESGTSGYLAFS